jgi:two-component system, chemotaxis family, protein-glutamate methylesterase/glutaminase
MIIKSKNFKYVVVIGTSAGGMKALIRLVSTLPENFLAPILIVQHISPEAETTALMLALNKIGRLKCLEAKEGVKIEAGCIYIAQPDHHLLLRKQGIISITKGAQENRFRPAIDPLFRSAATSFGNRAIGILLTGYLDDGTAGLIAIQRCGGTTIIQDPNDADYPDMPRNALNQMKPHFCVALNEIGLVLAHLLSKKLSKQLPIPKDIIKEAAIAEQVLSDLPSVNALGEQVPFNCPGCGGVLWKINGEKASRYRCHTSHAYTASSLLIEQTIKIKETMWTALRMFEESRNLLTTLAKENKGAASKSANERAATAQIHIDRIRAILLSD